MQVNRQLTSKKNREKIKETYQTIIFDEVYTASLYCQQYVCDQHGVATIGEGNGGFGLWKEYETTFWKEIDKLLKMGMTIVFIIHVDENKDGKFVPKGDKRSVDPVIDNSDVVAFLKPNGLDESHKPIPSSAFFIETDQWFARTRFTHMVPAIKVFTYENLKEALEVAIEKEEEVSGVKAQTHEEKKQTTADSKEALSHEEVLERIKVVGTLLGKNSLGKQANEIVREHLGVHKDENNKIIDTVKPSEIHPNDVDKLYVMLLDLEELASENGIEL